MPRTRTVWCVSLPRPPRDLLALLCRKARLLAAVLIINEGFFEGRQEDEAAKAAAKKAGAMVR